MDRVLRRYGPEAQDIRELLRRYAAMKLNDLFPAHAEQVAVDNEPTVAVMEMLQDRVLALALRGPRGQLRERHDQRQPRCLYKYDPGFRHCRHWRRFGPVYVQWQLDPARYQHGRGDDFHA